MTPNTITVRLMIDERGVDAFDAALAIVGEAAEDMPWREDLAEAVAHLIEAAEHLRPAGV